MKFKLSLEPTRIRRKASTIRITINCIAVFEHIMILLVPENINSEIIRLGVFIPIDYLL
jgi:hypothetical protein